MKKTEINPFFRLSFFLALTTKNVLSLLFFCVFGGVVHAQVDVEENSTESKRIFSVPKKKKEKPPIDKYQIISVERDTTYLDTTLSIQKEYKFNFLRKDDFELVAFPNIGKPYVQLAKQQKHFSETPGFAAQSRHIAYLEAQDINYYRVPTPLTELYFKTASEQGQQLDAFLTVNTSPRLNFSLAYKGVRSLGVYQNVLTSTKSFRSTLSYSTENKKYVANAHFTDQTLLNQENGGFSDFVSEQFVSGRADFSDRATLDVNFQNAENFLEGKRFYLNHEYRLLKPDSLQKNQISLHHILDRTVKDYVFEQDEAIPTFFGEAKNLGAFRDKTELGLFSNQVGVKLSNTHLGKLSFAVKQTNYNYGYNSVFIKTIGPNAGRINNRLQGNLTSGIASYKNAYKGFLLEGNVNSTLVGDYKNQYFLGTAGYQFKKDVAFKFGYKLTSEAPNFNQLLYQSNYVDYNWQNDFDNVLTNSFLFDLKSKKLADISVSYSLIDNYTYFGRESASVSPVADNSGDIIDVFVSTPRQTDVTLGLLKVKLFKEFKYHNFGLVNTLMYQWKDGDESNSLYNIPAFVTRNSLYYQNKIFRKAMFVQTGFNFRYFSSYNVDGYDALLAENYVQNTEKFGGFLSTDFFFNAKVRQTRIFFKLENMQSLFQQNTQLIAPNYPSRDFLFRFGLVWNFFL